MLPPQGASQLNTRLVTEVEVHQGNAWTPPRSQGARLCAGTRTSAAVNPSLLIKQDAESNPDDLVVVYHQDVQAALLGAVHGAITSRAAVRRVHLLTERSVIP
jgi:hypothetical protein